MTDDAPTATRRDRRDRAYLQQWLRRHGPPDRPPTALLAARVLARRRGEQIELAAVGLVVAFLASQFLWAPPAEASTAQSLALTIAAFAALQVGGLVALAHIRRTDRRISATLPARVARPSAMPLRTMLGGLFLAGAIAVYGSGLLAGGAGLLLATDTGDRAVALVLLLGLAIFAGLGMAVLTDVSRRPAVAEDVQSLADDDALRRDDAHRAVTPFLPVLALVAAAHSRSGDPLLLVYLCYALVSGTGWTLAFAAARYASRRPPADAIVPQVALR